MNTPAIVQNMRHAARNCETATIGGGEFGPKELKQAATLIAAAPDLLDALRRVMRHIPADAGGASLSDDMYRARKAVDLATSED